MKLYLAGGMHGDWREQYRVGLPKGTELFDPRKHDLSMAEDYVLWDLTAIEECDILVGYMEEDNPSGLGLALEIGYAKALGKKIILVLDHEFVMQDRYRYFLMAEVCADSTFTDHKEALKLIQSLCKII